MRVTETRSDAESGGLIVTCIYIYEKKMARIVKFTTDIEVEKLNLV